MMTIIAALHQENSRISEESRRRFNFLRFIRIKPSIRCLKRYRRASLYFKNIGKRWRAFTVSLGWPMNFPAWIGAHYLDNAEMVDWRRCHQIDIVAEHDDCHTQIYHSIVCSTKPVTSPVCSHIHLFQHQYL